MRKNLILLFFLAQPLSASPRYGLVQVPVADVRSSSGSLPASFDFDPNEETQVLYGEPVDILGESGGWLNIRAAEQLEFSHHNVWEGYPGWVKKEAVTLSDKTLEPKFIVKKKIGRLHSRPDEKSPFVPLSIGAKLVETGAQKNGFWKVKTVQGKTAWILKSQVRLLTPPLPEEYSRKMIVENASQLLGDLYFWGGRSAHMPEPPGQVSSVDCSGLTNLAYRVAGIDIPRDSYEQYLKARKIKKEALKMGDLIFSAAKDKPEKISHVAIFVDTAAILEAPKTGETVRKISFEQKYGLSFDQIKEGEPVGERFLYFGTYFDR